MKRLLTLTSNDFYTGLSAGAHVDRGGLFSDAEGVNVFVNPTQDSVDAGLLQTCATPTDITGTVSGIPTDYSIVNGEMWFVTTAGDIASVDLSGTGNASVEVDATAHTFAGTTYNGIGTGCQWFAEQQGATNYLYYFSHIDSTYYLSRVSEGGTDDADYLSLGSVAPTVRPIVQFKDRLYYGDIYNPGSKNTYCISSLYSNASSTITSERDSLDMPTNRMVTALTDDGTYLVIAATENTSLDRAYYGDTSVYFWDTNQSSWTREFKIPDTHITSMYRVGDRIYAVGGRGLWVFSFQSRPYKIRTLGTSDSTGTNYHGAIGSLNNAVLYGGGGNSKVFAYGEMMQGIGVNNVYHCPFAYPSDNANTSMICADGKPNYIFTGNANSKLYRWDITSGGSTSVTAETVYIPLQEKTNIREVEIILGEKLATNDSLNIDLQSDEDSTATDWGTVSEASHGNVQRVSLKGSKRNVENLRLILNFNGGNVKIKRINVYGTREPVAPR